MHATHNPHLSFIGPHHTTDHTHRRRTLEGPSHMDGTDAMMMPMSLLLSCSCKVGPLFVRAWTIETCGQYYISLVVIALVCFLRHLLTMYKTRLILRLPEGAAVGAFGV